MIPPWTRRPNSVFHFLKLKKSMRFTALFLERYQWATLNFVSEQNRAISIFKPSGASQKNQMFIMKVMVNILFGNFDSHDGKIIRKSICLLLRVAFDEAIWENNWGCIVKAYSWGDKINVGASSWKLKSSTFNRTCIPSLLKRPWVKTKFTTPWIIINFCWTKWWIQPVVVIADTVVWQHPLKNSCK